MRPAGPKTARQVAMYPASTVGPAEGFPSPPAAEMHPNWCG